jgi:DNA-damage-inducible protein J
MAKTATVRARIDDELKEQAEAVLASYGFTMSHAIIMMIRQLVIQQKIPFSLEGVMQPNARTLAVMEAIDSGEMPICNASVTAWSSTAWRLATPIPSY